MRVPSFGSRTALFFFTSVVLVPLCVASQLANTTPGVQYTVSLAQPEQHLFHVTMWIHGVRGSLILQMPAWNALYQVRDFSSHVRDVHFLDPHMQSQEAERVDKQTWRVQGNGELIVTYTTYWDEVGPFATQLNAEHAFINPAMILMYMPERRGEPVSVVLDKLPEGWQPASAMQWTQDFVRTSGPTYPMYSRWTAEHTTYDDLADAPIEVGTFKEVIVPRVPANIRAVIHGDGWSQKKIEEELSRICSYEVKLMDGAPFEHYTFILHIGRGAGGGGMEHANSTAIGISSDEFLAGVAAHEFFHLWNVKRIRPETLEPVDYTKEQYTRALWFAEGVTSTYGAYTLMRTGIWSKERAYADLGDQISELESRPANHWQSAEESSLDAWLEKYALYNGPDYSVSYYTKGQVLGVLLDFLIRDRTNNAKSLDDVLRGLNNDFAKQGKFYRDSLDIRLEAEKVAGGSFEDFFRDYVAAAKPLPYANAFALAGLQVQTREAKAAVLGFSAERDASGSVTVRAVDPGTPAADAGLRPGDVIVNWNGGEVPRSLRRWVHDRQPGEGVKARIRRDEKEMNIEFKLGEEKEVRYQVGEEANAGEKARRIRDGWLRGTTQAAASH